MDRRTFLFSFAAAGAALAGFLPEDADAAPQWRPLGTTRVNGLVDIDRIAVGVAKGTFKRLRVRVRGNALLIYDLRVRYGNGTEERLPVRSLIPQGGSTRAIDLRGSNRAIRYVTFAYGKFANGRGPTFVDLYGWR